MAEATHVVLGAVSTLSDVVPREPPATHLDCALFDSLPDAAFLLDPTTGRIVEVNRVMAWLYGYTQGEMVGLTIDEYSAEPEPTTQAIRDGEDCIHARNHKKRDGAVFPIEIMSHPVFYEGRSLIVGVVRDVTERRRAEEARDRSEELYRTLVESSQCLVWRCDDEGRFVFLNKAWELTLGYSPEEMLGRHFWDFQPAAAREVNRALFALHLGGEPIPPFDNPHVSSRGEELDLYFWAVAVRDSSGKVVGIQGTAIDITERKRADAKLKQLAAELTEANRVQDIFTDVLRHDILDPINLIRMSVDTMLEIESDASKRPILERIRRSTVNLQEMTENAATLARHAACQTFDLDDEDPVQLLRAILPDYDPYLVEKDLVLSDRSTTDGFVARVNPIIREVFTNLISNAIKYCPIGSKVEVGVDEAGDSWVFWVLDHGAGVPDNYKKSIFNRFERLGREGVKGSGLGLTITQQIVRWHGGEILVEDAPQGGSRFVVTLPKHPPFRAALTRSS